ncbi:MAG: N-acetylglutaminylglutamine synthetase [Phycisphaera sp.]|nr:N-acetylglutaminylglutamine synthetase [Phycisphaera sp.]
MHSEPRHPQEALDGPSQRHWEASPDAAAEQMRADVSVHMGWGRLIFAHTYASCNALAETLCAEKPDERDIALYVRDPHVVLSLAPQNLFLDPSHTYRLWQRDYAREALPESAFVVRTIRDAADVEAVNRIYASRNMVRLDAACVLEPADDKDLRLYLVAEDTRTAQVIGAVSGIDHVRAFDDPENGASLWCLAVDPQAFAPGIGETMVRTLLEHYFDRGRDYVDLSVMHDNRLAIKLYDKLGFVRTPAFCVKHKNPINEPLFIAPQPEADGLNPYARIIVDEARRRGIGVEIEDAETGYFALHFGGRSIVCRESLSELTTAVAMSRCDDKRVTRRVLADAELRVPRQAEAGDEAANAAFLREHGRIVVKPARGEQGAGISVDVRDEAAMAEAVAAARRVCDVVLLEELVAGDDLRVIVIDFNVVAAAVRRPAQIVGTGEHTIEQLIGKYNRRRLAATDGESSVPLDGETQRCVADAGYAMGDVLPDGVVVTARKTANLHTGGTIHDVTDTLHPALAEAAVAAARAIDIPVVGLDLMTPDVAGPDYHIIEANERPGLANHEPQPTAERFVDLLFPHSVGPTRQG